ncbi:MAG: HepT-like ribonuclease domain-containing protein [Cyanobacteria bacterium J06648_16]
MRSNADRLVDITQSIAKIEWLLAGGKNVFDEDEAIQERVVYHFQIIGEAANGISREMLAHYPDVSWPEVVGLRNILIHHYWEIDFETVWSISQTTLPVLKQTVERMVSELQAEL